MRNNGNCGVEGWFGITEPRVTPAPADGAMVTMEVAGLDATEVWLTGFVTVCGLMRMVCSPGVGLTSADGRLCNSCTHTSNSCQVQCLSECIH